MAAPQSRASPKPTQSWLLARPEWSQLLLHLCSLRRAPEMEDSSE